MFAEKDHRTAVRENKAFPFNTSGIIIMVSDLFQKRRHLLLFSAKIVYLIAKP